MRWSLALILATACDLSAVEFATLRVERSGEAEGVIRSFERGAIDCGMDCVQAYARGAIVTLSAEVPFSARFEGWTGACQGTQSVCNLTMNEDLVVGGRFAPNDYAIEVGVAGTGTGTISSDPEKIRCPGRCGGRFLAGTPTVLTATPDPSSTFEGWGSPCSGNERCLLTATASVTGRFALKQHLVVVNAGAGGRVRSEPAGIDCGATCAATWPYGTRVVLSAEPDAGGSFLGFSGGCSGASPCSITVDRDFAIVASFRPPPARVAVTVTGNGKVASTPAAINCGADCAATFEIGTELVLQASANAGARFSAWAAGPCANAGPRCQFTVRGPADVGVRFE